MRRATVLLLGTVFAIGCSQCTRSPQPAPDDTAHAPPPAKVETASFEVTAYSIEGKTAQGTRSREGVVAADPRVLPLGSRVRIVDAGEYSGEYVVEDTGRAIKGHELDLYLADDAEAKRFGRKTLKVEILGRGN